MLVVPAGIQGTLCPKSAGGLGVLHFHFHAELLNGFLRLEERHALELLRSIGAQGVKHYAAGTPVARRFRQVSERMAPPDMLLHRCQLLELVGIFLDLHKIKLRLTPLTALDGKTRIRRVIEEMPRGELACVSVEELEGKCGCSRRHINRVLKQYLGRSLGALKMELRLEKAASLLLSAEGKVLDVALDCGFSHLGQFSAKFRSRFGTTPAAWRRQRLADARDTPLAAATSLGVTSEANSKRRGASKPRVSGRSGPDGRRRGA